MQDHLHIKWVPHRVKPPLLAPSSVNDLPGRKPGTSTKVMSGMLNASQNRTKRAPFTDELISKHPTREKLSMLSFWAIPSSTHSGNVLSATIQELISAEAPTSLPHRMVKENKPSHSRKNRADKRTQLDLAQAGPGVASAPRAPLRGAEPRADQQAASHAEGLLSRGTAWFTQWKQPWEVSFRAGLRVPQPDVKCWPQQLQLRALTAHSEAEVPGPQSRKVPISYQGGAS